jgi:hypothetical protein
MWKNRNSTLRVMLTAAVLLVPLAMCSLPAAYASEAPPPSVEAAGKVVGSTSNDRDIKVQAGTLEVTLFVPKEARIEHKGKSISVHDIKKGTYVWAHGVRSGNTKVKVDHLQVVGDRYDFMNSKLAQVNGEHGYVRKAPGMSEVAPAAQPVSKPAPEQPAEAQKPEAKPVSGTAPAQSPPPSKGKLIAQKLAWLSQELGLTEKQKRKARPLVRDMTNRCLAVQGTPGLTPEKMKAKQIVIINHDMMSMRQTILTPQQKIKYDEIKEQAIEKMLVERNAAKQG